MVTLEYEPKHAEVALANLQRAGVDDRVEIKVGAALDTLPTVTGGPFDLVFIDADKENYVAYLEWAIQLARPGAVIVADNVIRGRPGVHGDVRGRRGVRGARDAADDGRGPPAGRGRDPDRRGQALGWLCLRDSA